MPSQEVIDAFIEMELKQLPPPTIATRMCDVKIAKGTTFKVGDKKMEFPKDVVTRYVALMPVNGLPIMLWYRNVVSHPKKR